MYYVLNTVEIIAYNSTGVLGWKKSSVKFCLALSSKFPSKNKEKLHISISQYLYLRKNLIFRGAFKNDFYYFLSRIKMLLVPKWSVSRKSFVLAFYTKFQKKYFQVMFGTKRSAFWCCLKINVFWTQKYFFWLKIKKNVLLRHPELDNWPKKPELQV